MDYKAKLCDVLDLDANKATDEDIAQAAAEVDSLASGNDAVTNRLADVSALQTEVRELREQLADSDLAPVAAQLSDTDRAAIREGLVTNRAATLPLLKLAIANRGGTLRGPIANRDAKSPADRQSAAPRMDAAGRNAIVRGIQNREQCSFEAALAIAAREKPELFAVS